MISILMMPELRRGIRLSVLLLSVLIPTAVWAGIPATPVMTLYQFNGPLEIPYYDLDSFLRSGPSNPAGTLIQGTSVIPCLVVLDGKALTDEKGTPYVGFQVVVDSRTATEIHVERFQQALSQRASMMTVANHHCDPGAKRVIDVRKLYPLKKAPFFEPQPARTSTGRPPRASQGELDEIIRAFHNSPQCELANRSLIGRRSALQRAWDRFAAANQSRWPMPRVDRARHIDYVMRTAIFEGHQDRGCNAYGSCERNVIALSIRNRGREGCLGRQGCRAKGDFEGVSSNVSQYNIWDEYLTQISGLTTCFLRDDLGGPNGDLYRKMQGMYEQSLADVQTIIFGDDRDLQAIFPGNDLEDIKVLRHYYHAPAMGKCFPNHERIEYISGAVARKGSDFALLANTRIRVDQRTEGGYFFRGFRFEAKDERDEVEIVDSYPGFVVDDRKVELKEPQSCAPYGIPRGCRFEEIGRYRTTPSWLSSGRPIEVTCNVKDRGESCQGAGTPKTAKVGGMCDTQMRPVAGVK